MILFFFIAAWHSTVQTDFLSWLLCILLQYGMYIYFISFRHMLRSDTAGSSYIHFLKILHIYFHRGHTNSPFLWQFCQDFCIEPFSLDIESQCSFILHLLDGERYWALCSYIYWIFVLLLESICLNKAKWFLMMAFRFFSEIKK